MWKLSLEWERDRKRETVSSALFVLLCICLFLTMVWPSLCCTKWFPAPIWWTCVELENHKGNEIVKSCFGVFTTLKMLPNWARGRKEVVGRLLKFWRTSDEKISSSNVKRNKKLALKMSPRVSKPLRWEIVIGEQCDQMAMSFFNIWQYVANTSLKICQSRFKILPNTYQP